MLALTAAGDLKELASELENVEIGPELRRDLRLGGLDRYLPLSYAVLVCTMLALAIGATGFWRRLRD